MPSFGAIPAVCYDGREEDVAEMIMGAHAEVLIASKGFEPNAVDDDEMIGRIMSVVLPSFGTIFGTPPYARYKDIFEQMAEFATRLAKDHLFFDGNKRTTVKVTFAMLHKAGITLAISDPDDVENNEVYLWIQDIVTGGRSKEELATYLRSNYSRI